MSVQPPHGFPDPNQGHHPQQGGPQGPYGHSPVPPGYPQQQPPQGGFPPPAGGPGFPGRPGGPGLPDGPQGPFPPAGPHPQGGYPGAPAPRPKRTGLVVGGAIACAAVLLVGIGTAVVLNMPREYVSFPDCDEIFNVVTFENAVEATGLVVSGEFTEADGEDHGSLRCEVSSGYGDESWGGFSISVDALAPEGEEWQEAFDEIEKIREEVPQQLSQGERGALTIDGDTIDDALWRTSSAGDTGVVIGATGESSYFSMGTATNVFLADNLGVAVVYMFEPESAELEEAVDMVRSLSDKVERALRRAGETA